MNEMGSARITHFELELNLGHVVLGHRMCNLAPIWTLDLDNNSTFREEVRRGPIALAAAVTLLCVVVHHKPDFFVHKL